MEAFWQSLQLWWQSLCDQFYQAFIQDNRWEYITDGLLVTLEVTFFAVLIGIVFGFLLAIVRTAHEKTGKLKILNAIAHIYVTVIRGIPTTVQVMLAYFVIFVNMKDPIPVAILAFGVNSSAYVAEIMRGGILAVDAGQMEAGRSLGLTYTQTMKSIILPQVIKNVLPALGNEFIVLMKETSVSAFIGLNELTRGGDIIRGITYTDMLPLLAVALIYLVLVMIFSRGVSILERRLRASDH